MSHGVLIVEPSGLSGGEDKGFAALVPEWGVPRRTTWETFAPAEARSAREQLIIAHAVPGEERASAFFHWLRNYSLPMPVFAILPANDGALFHAALEAVDDFLVAPVRPDELRQRIGRCLGPHSQNLAQVQSSLTAEIGLGQLVGQAPAFIRVVEKVALFGANDAPVLLTGQTGTGKELCARVTHLLSRRRLGPFIPVDCGAIPDHLFENEIFGHTRGAFTDARTDQKGLVALAESGTLFLDEIDSLSLMAQGKVLRLLQEHTYRPLGSEVFKRADVRILAGSNGNLQQLVEQKAFRSDLYFRIHVLHVHLPPLRERRSDIEILSRHFIEDICRSSHLPRKVLSHAATRKLNQHDWPGNVRELYNTLQRAVLCSPGTQIAAPLIDIDGFQAPPLEEPGETAPEKFRSAKLRAIQCFEREYVRRMMNKHAGNVTQAARDAGKDRRAFGRLVKKYGFDPSAE
jgi:DNA-binding NtrC family response regulator